MAKKGKKEPEPKPAEKVPPVTVPPAAVSPAQVPQGQKRINKKTYWDELRKLQIELVKLQEWIRFKGLKVVVIFEGRDAAGKGGAIKRITESLNPRVCRVVALPTATEREKTQWYFQPGARWCCSTAAGTTAPGWNG